MDACGVHDNEQPLRLQLACLRTYHGTSPPNVNLRLELAWATQAQPKFEGVRKRITAPSGSCSASNSMLCAVCIAQVRMHRRLHHVDMLCKVPHCTPQCPHECTDCSAYSWAIWRTVVTNAELLALFKDRYPSVFETHVVGDPATGLSKGYGFVRFADAGERDRSLQEMQGTTLHGRTLRVSVASKRPASTEAHDRAMFSPAVTQARPLQLHIARACLRCTGWLLRPCVRAARTPLGSNKELVLLGTS